ncbi:probable membrane metalloprotease ARASP2, chloroplastic [Andrographis paniculata]|uniref:probable membrane metalloprotease ARASP2, chloroplastic n=1 Tax=Andrographis paniculata TaxID=175694 RepID=UPI0021E784CE|nr:probable membrane metalloprotease ARASP2, chloroplastic [Andrographis paniculata]
MIINLPSSSSSLRFLSSNSNSNSKSQLSLKTASHLSKPFSPSSYSRFCGKGTFIIDTTRFRRPAKFKNFAIAAAAGLDLGGFESAQSVIEAAAVLTAIIVVHESGHFLAAHLQGIHVSKFAVGFGPILAKFNFKNVEYSVRAFPLGGFVGFPDNDPDSDIPVDDVNLLKNRPIFDRVIVISAGVIANIIFAYVIVLLQVLSVGLPVQESFPGVLVPDVTPFSAASRDGLLPGDIILGVNDVELVKASPGLVSEVVDVIRKSPKRKVALKVARGNENVIINVTPDKNVDGSGRIGVQLSPNVKFSKVVPKNLFEVFSYSWREFWGLTVNVLDSLKQMFLNFSQSAGKVSGPVAIIAVGAEVAKSNSDGLFQFAAILNLNLAVINLLPLPALDGGSLALVLVEAVRGGRKLPLEVEQRITSSGIMAVLILGIYLLVRDTLNLDFVRDLL